MQVRRINGMFSIANQVEAQNIESLVHAGYKTLICNRPDGETGDFDAFAKIAEMAKRYGIKAVYLPIEAVGASPEDQNAFDELILDCPKPIVAYCRSGTRPATLWTMFDVKHNGSHRKGLERRVDAMQRGALSVQHNASMAYAASFNPPKSTATRYSSNGLHRKSA
ncbi:beta-lactamase hydrolase domain-containing protein [Pacificibacter marinus]|uniref:Beta-lactamase hydrolase-like protein n=1 Tax=Pacificibacter marinus TaxID=658057 RepID=A0A1Y5RX43_9RHOB|nr:sulfur transferase domain-containing protein [Pacificibacter marinus]SEK40977.1 TIGR01244 family protein [Pacificibacter marinus]SLN24936.1 Beta-lactamase hydrolase-like protein [Pacificibacter marinus]